MHHFPTKAELLTTAVEHLFGRRRADFLDASVRRTGNYSGYSLDVVGPDSVAGCQSGATLTFRINGRPVSGTGTNTANNLGRGGSLDLTRP